MLNNGDASVMSAQYISKIKFKDLLITKVQLEYLIVLHLKKIISLIAGFPTVPEMPACRPDEFDADQHVIGHIRLLSSWQIS